MKAFFIQSNKLNSIEYLRKKIFASIKMKRTLVIGDIHGGLKALIQLLQKTNLVATDKLIFLGDYVDGWSESAQTIDYLMELNKTYDCVFIKGNHDAWCQDWLNGKNADQTWLRHGGRETIESYKNYSALTIEIHRKFFNALQNFFIDEENRLFIHAGFSSMQGPVKEMYASNFSWDRTLWEMALVLDKTIDATSKFYPKRLLLFKEIYLGHTPTTNYDISIPMNAFNVWNIDTGAAFFGKISALDIETKKYWQSEPCFKLYPDEEGRN